MQAVRDAGTELVPVDSEHSARLPGIAGADPAAIERIVLTASGGPFRTWSREQLAHATPRGGAAPSQLVDGAQDHHRLGDPDEQGPGADRGPPPVPGASRTSSRWSCTRSRSCTRWWRYRDGSMLAQLASPDMRTPIALSLAWPARMAAPTKRLDLVEVGTAELRAPRRGALPALGLARQAMQRGGMAPAVLNAANEVAVEAFLARRIGFLQIAQLVAETLRAGRRPRPAGRDVAIWMACWPWTRRRGVGAELAGDDGRSPAAP